MTPEEIEAKIKADVEKATAALSAKNTELLNEKKAEKARADKLEADKAALDLAAAKEKGDFKTLSEKYATDLQALKDEGAAKEKQRILELKRGAVSLELDKLGINSERKAFVLGSANLDALQYVETSNTILGADVKAKEMQSLAPEFFGNKNNQLPGQGGAPPAGGNGGAAPVHMSQEWFDALSVKDQDINRKAFLASKGVTMR
jgi:hypothetical protein